MLTEGISGTCPCCGYEKMLQRYGSIGYYQMDGCPNCGFGYGSNHHDQSEPIGLKAWLDVGLIELAITEEEKYYDEFQDDLDVIRRDNGYEIKDGGKTKEMKAFEKAKEVLGQLDDLTLRRKIFEMTEAHTPHDGEDHIGTVFKYTDEDIAKYKATNPVIFKAIPVE